MRERVAAGTRGGGEVIPPRRLVVGAALGSGAVASVHRVESYSPDGRCEIFAGKLLHPSHGPDAAAAARFEQEGRLLEGVHDRHLVEVFGIVEVEHEGAARRMLLMEYVEGPSLAELIAREAPLRAERILELALGIARGLRAAHSAGVIHRDLKPANVLLAPGDVVKIADFGMARASATAGVDPSALVVLGTPDYMAPECLDPLAVDPRTDLYALGAIIYEMATGGPVFTGATSFAVLDAHRHAAVPPLPEQLPEGLRALTMALLAKSPADRPQAADTVVAALTRLCEGESRALVVPAVPSGARCAACGQVLVPHVGACMNCGLPMVRLAPGEVRLVVVGPGAPGDKLDSVLRERLRQWLDGNPLLGLRAGRLDKVIPRLPFVLTGRISQESAESLRLSLREIGIDGRVVGEAVIAVPEMKKKITSLLGRVALIGATSAAGILHMGSFVGVALVAAFAVVSAVVVRRSLERVTHDDLSAQRALPVALHEAFGRVERVLPAISTTRHRHALRAVVERAVLLADEGDDEPRVEAGEFHAQLARAVDLAAVASARLDELDRELRACDLRSASPETRVRLHERDTWAARLLDLTAGLDGVWARTVAASAQRGEGDDRASLADLRLRVEALEEVQRG